MHKVHCPIAITMACGADDRLSREKRLDLHYLAIWNGIYFAHPRMRIRFDRCESPIQVDDIRAAGVGRVQSVCAPPRLDDGGVPNEPLGICSHESGHCICCNEACGTETFTASHPVKDTGAGALHLQ